MTTPTPDEIISEIQVWYDAIDGVRRSFNAVDEAHAQQIIGDLNEEENRRQLLAQSVGLTVPPHDWNVTTHRVTTTKEQVEL